MATVTSTLLATIGDPDGTRTVTSIIALLVAIGLALLMVAVWLWRTTRPDPDLLAPLEMMGEGRWRRSDPVAQRRRLDAARPAGAKPLTPAVEPPRFDESFDAGPTASGFDDLGDDAAGATERAASIDSLSRYYHPPMESAAETPRQIDRPVTEDFEGDIDPEALAAARAALDDELDGDSGDADR